MFTPKLHKTNGEFEGKAERLCLQVSPKSKINPPKGGTAAERLNATAANQMHGGSRAASA